MGLQTDEVYLTGGVETVFASGTPTAPLPLDITEFAYNPNFTSVERNLLRSAFSPVAQRIGRKSAQMTFSVEARGTGKADGSVAPGVGAFLRGCGFAQTALTSPSGRIWGNPENVGAPTLAVTTTAYTGKSPRLVTITMTTAAQARITAHETPNGDVAVNTNNTPVTTATAFGNVQGATFMLTWTAGNAPAIGDRFYAWLLPPGFLYTPASSPDTFESVAVLATVANKTHTLGGAFGTFQLSATAGETAKFNFDYTGDFRLPIAGTVPSRVTTPESMFGATPPMFELADISIDDVTLACPTTFAVDLGGTISTRLCANAAAANNGAQLTARKPTATFNMDSVPIATAGQNVWQMLNDAKRIVLSAYIGQKPGNTIHVIAQGQINNTQYGDVDSIRKNENTMNLAGVQGNDELMIFVG